jgi:hypothetical protein
MSLSTLLFVVTLVIVFSGAEVLKLLITELLQPPSLAEEARTPAPLLLVQAVQAAVPAGAEPAGGAREAPPSGAR